MFTVAYLSKSHSDTHFAIELLWRAAVKAGLDGEGHIRTDHAVQAFEEEVQMEQIGISALGRHIQLVLLSLARGLQEKSKTSLTTPELIDSYELLCDKLDERPRRGTTVHDYLIELQEMGFVEKTSSQDRPGLPSIIWLTSVSVEKVFQLLNHLVEELEDN